MTKGIQSLIGLALIALLAPAATGQAEPKASGEATTSTATASIPAVRDPRWAVPVTSRPGLPNLFKVGDNLYRGAQPEPHGFAELKKMGIKTVIDLRTFHSDRKECAANGLKYVSIPLLTWDIDPPQIRKFLKTVRDEENWPVFVHCMHGADRTGAMCAVTRIVDEDWTADEAITEMTQGNFGYHAVWVNIIKTMRGLDRADYARRPETKPGNGGR